jgi:hypothetical protein
MDNQFLMDDYLSSHPCKIFNLRLAQGCVPHQLEQKKQQIETKYKFTLFQR